MSSSYSLQNRTTALPPHAVGAGLNSQVDNLQQSKGGRARCAVSGDIRSASNRRDRERANNERGRVGLICMKGRAQFYSTKPELAITQQPPVTDSGQLASRLTRTLFSPRRGVYASNRGDFWA